MPRVNIVPGSARGARVAGVFWAIFILVVAGFMIYAYRWWEGMIVAIPASGFLLIRPWFMGVELDSGAIVVKSWWRVYRYQSKDVVLIDIVECVSFLVGFGTRFLPIAGNVRMLEIEVKKGGRLRILSFPAVFGRCNTMLRAVREMRTHVGLAR